MLNKNETRYRLCMFLLIRTFAMIFFWMFKLFDCDGQQIDTISVRYNVLTPMAGDSTGHHLAEAPQKKHPWVKAIAIPTGLIAFGFISLESDALKSLDNEIQKEVWQEHPHKPFKLDNYLQYTPAAMVYALNVTGIKGKHNLADRSMIYLMSNAMMGVTVQSLKAITRIPRPDGGGTNAFPSGHTATAFVSAEFLRREYRDVSPWYGIAGYTMATATAFLRMYNNKHWFRDLLPGAGIGILSTDVAYLIYPSVKRIFFKREPVNTMIFPFYQGGNVGITAIKEIK